MGAIDPGIPRDLVVRLSESLGITALVETGTYQGDSALWASGVFPEVVTIEASPELHANALCRLLPAKNVTLLLGDSRELLRRLVPTLTRPTMFWLDAHWSDGRTVGKGDECPLLGELHAVLGSPVDHLVLIDDARYFLAPPPDPHNGEQWPTILQICEVFKNRGFQVYVFRDVIFGASLGAAERVTEVLKEAATRELLERSRPSRDAKTTVSDRPRDFCGRLRAAAKVLLNLTP